MTWDSPEAAKVVRDKRAEREETLRRDAMDRTRQVSAFLKREHGVSKVVLYGSLAEGFFQCGVTGDRLVNPTARLASQSSSYAC